MNIKFSDNTILEAVNASAGKENFSGAFRDMLSLEFPEETGFENLKTLGQSAENTMSITITGSDGTGYQYDGYTMFGGLTLEPSGRLRLKLGQKISSRETDLMAQNAALQSTVDTLVMDSLGGAA